MWVTGCRIGCGLVPRFKQRLVIICGLLARKHHFSPWVFSHLLDTSADSDCIHQLILTARLIHRLSCTATLQSDLCTVCISNGSQWGDKSFIAHGEHAHIIPFPSTNCRYTFLSTSSTRPRNITITTSVLRSNISQCLTTKIQYQMLSDSWSVMEVDVQSNN